MVRSIWEPLLPFSLAWSFHTSVHTTQVPEPQRNPASYFHPKDPAGVTLCPGPPSWPSLCLTPQLPVHCASATGFSSQRLKNTKFSSRPRAFARAVPSAWTLFTLLIAGGMPPRPSVQCSSPENSPDREAWQTTVYSLANYNLQSMGSQTVRHDWSDRTQAHAEVIYGKFIGIACF